ncbi:MAG: polyprenyl synthetase family protein, partial [Armatimonadetes bacterium]|nr:polyprenyl synthetase family protein [Armatimonadota bacterium]
LGQVVHSRLPVVPEVFLHTVHAGGKRVRPALGLLCGRACGAVGEATYDVAVAAELIHLASLIHDDVIDEGEFRRARRTAHRVWGNKSAVLVADYTHSVAYRLIAQRCSMDAVHQLSETVVRMVEGELSQMYNEGNLDVDEALYHEMIGDKTASLMALACALGAQVSGASAEHVETCREYGFKVGLAFQIVDDLLDLTGDEERLGKPVGNDVRCGRMTLPLIHTLSRGTAEEREALVALLRRMVIGPAEIHALREIIARSGGLDHARAAAQRYAGEACELLSGLPAGEPRLALEALAEYIVQRSQ